MALQINAAATTIGISCPKAYAKITSFHGDSNGVRFDVSIYATKAARTAGAQPVDYRLFQYPVDTSAQNIYAYGYAKLKLESEFARALDV